MPAKKTTSNTSSVNTAEFGRKYYDVLEVYKQKVMSEIVENARSLNIDKNVVTELNKILTKETASAKNWGFDQLISIVKGE